MLGATIAIEIVQSTENDVVFIDPAQLDQVLVNVALNARDAMPNGGTLRFEVSATDIDEANAGPLGIAAGPYVTLTVADTDDGIPADILDRIFEPFVTTKPVGVGTGLGLSTAYGIITQSGGAISATSQHGHGATFTIHLPVRQAQETSPTNAPAGSVEREATSPENAGTVLVVEDDHQVRAVIERVLTRAGYDVDAHELPLSAFEAISRSAPSLVLTDIVMPDLDGFELAERVRSLDAGIPVLFMSGFVDADRLAEISSGGQTIDLVAKPFTSVELLTRVAAALGRG